MGLLTPRMKGTRTAHTRTTHALNRTGFHGSNGGFVVLFWNFLWLINKTPGTTGMSTEMPKEKRVQRSLAMLCSVRGKEALLITVTTSWIANQLVLSRRHCRSVALPYATRFREQPGRASHVRAKQSPFSYVGRTRHCVEY